MIAAQGAGNAPAGDASDRAAETPEASEPAPAAPTEPGTSAPSPETEVDPDVAQFQERDHNQDGWLSGTEIAGIRHYDGDANGEVTLEEFLAGRASERLLMREGTVTSEDIDLFNALDSTGSGYISGIDIETGRVGDFDVDQNGRVTREEFYAGRARQRREIQEQARAAREAEARRRLAAGEPEPAPPLGQPLEPRRGWMRGRVLTPEGEPVERFMMEVIGYNIDEKDPRIDGRGLSEPNFIRRYEGRDGYYEIRLPDRSFGFAASITIPTEAGSKEYPLRSAGERRTIDYIEVQRSSEGVVKDLIWDPAASEIKPRFKAGTPATETRASSPEENSTDSEEKPSGS